MRGLALASAINSRRVDAGADGWTTSRLVRLTVCEIGAYSFSVSQGRLA